MAKAIVTRATTGDRGPPEGGVVIHTVEQLGPNMSLLPNGSLLCRNVPLARTGWMMYGPNETPIKVAKGTDVAYVQRTDKTLFAPDTLASFVGASIVDEHPEVDVTPENWKKLAKGTVLTARRGEGDDADLVIGDVLVTDAALIRSIQSGKREVSAGYDADYEQISDGVGQQTNIIVNHIALVEKGRCGPRCAIGDREYQPPTKGKPQMATKRVQIKTGASRRVTLDTLRKRVIDAETALQTAQEAESEAQQNEEALEGDDLNGQGDTHIHIHTGAKGAGDTRTEDNEEEGEEQDPTEARFTAIENALAKLTEMVGMLAKGNGNPSTESDQDGETGDADLGEGDPEDDENGGVAGEKSIATGDDDGAGDYSADSAEDFGQKSGMAKDGKTKDGKTRDSAALESGWKTLLAKAEVLVPGFRVPTFDAKAPRKKTVDSMCALRRKVMDAAWNTKDGSALIQGITGKSSLGLAKMGCADVAVLFNAASGAKAAINNAKATHDSAGPQAAAPKGIPSLAAINKANADFWAKHTPKV